MTPFKFLSFQSLCKDIWFSPDPLIKRRKFHDRNSMEKHLAWFFFVLVLYDPGSNCSVHTEVLSKKSTATPASGGGCDNHAANVFWRTSTCQCFGAHHSSIAPHGYSTCLGNAPESMAKVCSRLSTKVTFSDKNTHMPHMIWSQTNLNTQLIKCVAASLCLLMPSNSRGGNHNVNFVNMIILESSYVILCL